MPVITVAVFAGEVPRLGARLLETPQATRAVNCDLARGVLRPLRAPGRIGGLRRAAKTIFKHATDGWLSWPGVVSVVKSAIFDAEGDKPLGQLLMTGERAYPTMYLAGGEIYRLGIPRPEKALTVMTASGAALRNATAVAFASGGFDNAPSVVGYQEMPVEAESDVRLEVTAQYPPAFIGTPPARQAAVMAAPAAMPAVATLEAAGMPDAMPVVVDAADGDTDGEADTGIALLADTDAGIAAHSAFSISAIRSGNRVLVVFTGAPKLPIRYGHDTSDPSIGIWSVVHNVTPRGVNAVVFDVPAYATRIYAEDAEGTLATSGMVEGDIGEKDNGSGNYPGGGSGSGSKPGGGSGSGSGGNWSDGTPDECKSLRFDRAACLEAKVLQMNDANADGRRDWTASEVAERIANAGFDSVEAWWNAYGDDEGVCPWDNVSCCRKAGYVYYAGGHAQKPEIVRSSAYCYTVVQRLAGGLIAYESAPSPPSEVIDVVTGDGVTLSGFVVPKAADLRITHVRIYRTVAGNTSSEWRFLVELTVGELAAAGWRYEDTAHDKDVSTEILQTSTWDPIPDNAKGLIKTDNGIYACFRGNELLLSEPFYPYAYPTAYRLTVEDAIVALAHVDNTIVVLTGGRPYLAQGSAPESMQLVHLPIEQSCVSAGSVATLPGGVIYASPDGLMLFSSNQQTLLTEQILTREQWQELGPERLLGSVHDGRYVGFFEGTGEGLLLHLGRSDLVRLRLPDGWIVRGLRHHSQDDALYLSARTPQGEGIWRFEGGGEYLAYVWRSKEFFTSALCGMTAARVQGAQNARNPVTLRVFGPDGQRCRDTRRISGGRAVRLRPTRAERLWSFELSGTAEIYEARLGSGVEGVEYGN